MNILFVNDKPLDPQYGGIERVTYLLAECLSAQYNHNIFYLCLNRKIESDLILPDFASIFYLPEEAYFCNEVNIAYYSNILADNKIDVVINQRSTYPEMDNVLDIGEEVIKIAAFHSIVNHTVVERLYTLTHTIDRSCLGSIKHIIKKMLMPLYLKYKTVSLNKELRNHYQLISQKSDACVLLSEKYFSDFRDICHPYIPNMLAIPNPNTFQLSHLNLDNKEKIILYVGRLKESDKSPLNLLKVWARIYNKHYDWKLFIVGTGEDLDLLQSYSKKCRLERVFFEGSKRNVASYYERATFICLTSKFEGWGMTLVEGMSFGCIPFTFNNYAAASDIIDDGVNGCLVPAFDIDLYANKLSDLISNENQRHLMAKNAFLKSQKFNLSRVAFKWDKLFRDLHYRRKIDSH